jgi:hypothetical protein
MLCRASSLPKRERERERERITITLERFSPQSPSSNHQRQKLFWCCQHCRLILPVLEFHINGIRQYTFLDLGSGFFHQYILEIYSIACLSSWSFLLLIFFPVAWIYYNLFIHFPVEDYRTVFSFRLLRIICYEFFPMFLWMNTVFFLRQISSCGYQVTDRHD